MTVSNQTSSFHKDWLEFISRCSIKTIAGSPLGIQDNKNLLFANELPRPARPLWLSDSRVVEDSPAESLHVTICSSSGSEWEVNGWRLGSDYKGATTQTCQFWSLKTSIFFRVIFLYNFLLVTISYLCHYLSHVLFNLCYSRLTWSYTGIIFVFQSSQQDRISHPHCS